MGRHSYKGRQERKKRKMATRHYSQWSPAVLTMSFVDGEPVFPWQRSYNGAVTSQLENRLVCEEIIRMATAGGCLFCGTYEGLTFHHRERKRFNICDRLEYRDPRLLRDEIERCVVLCGACHTWVHNKERAVNGFE